MYMRTIIVNTSLFMCVFKFTGVRLCAYFEPTGDIIIPVVFSFSSFVMYGNVYKGRQ